MISSILTRHDYLRRSVKQKDRELDRWVEAKENELKSNLNGGVDASVNDLIFLEAIHLLYHAGRIEMGSLRRLERSIGVYPLLCLLLNVCKVRLQSEYLAMDDAMYYLDR